MLIQPRPDQASLHFPNSALGIPDDPKRQDIRHLRWVRLVTTPLFPSPPSTPSSASGLGLATVKTLHQAGAHIAILDIQDVPQDFRDSCGAKVRFFKTDLTNAAEVEKAIQGVVEWVRSTKASLGGVVNSAGVASAAKVRQFCPHHATDRQYTRRSTAVATHIPWTSLISSCL